VRVAAPGKPWYRKAWSYAGLGFLVSVGYSALLDPTASLSAGVVPVSEAPGPLYHLRRAAGSVS